MILKGNNKLKKIVIIFAMLSAIMNGSTQQDTILSHSLDYPTKGIYVSAPCLFQERNLYLRFKGRRAFFYEGIKGSLQIELKRNRGN